MVTDLPSKKLVCYLVKIEFPTQVLVQLLHSQLVVVSKPNYLYQEQLFKVAIY